MLLLFFNFIFPSVLPISNLFLGGIGHTWSKNFCMYTKENKIFKMVPYVQTQAKLVSACRFNSRMCALQSKIPFTRCSGGIRNRTEMFTVPPVYKVESC